MSTEGKTCEFVCHLDENYFRLVDHLSKLPHKILQYHDHDSLPQLILHELSHDSGFGFKKAIYLVDNPDFDHLVGAAGFCCDECEKDKEDIWGSPDAFLSDIKGACFHDEVRKIALHSIKKKDETLSGAVADIEEIGRGVGMEHPQFYAWKMKHGNLGILIYEQEKDLTEAQRNLFENTVALLSLCGF